MENLVLTLPTGGTVTGLINLPIRTPETARYRPLLVCLHGGTFSASYFDSPGQSIRSVSDAVQVPVVAIDRAGYRGSSMFNGNGAVPEGSSYQEEEGKWLHAHVLPTLWRSYAELHGLNCLVVLTHSMGTPPAIVAVAQQCIEVRTDQERAYNLGGLILSGWGFTPPPQSNEAKTGQSLTPRPARVGFPPDKKVVLMLGSREEGMCDSKIYSMYEGMDGDAAYDELDHGRNLWFNRAQSYTEQVEVPILHTLGEHDLLWPPSGQKPDACQVSFPKSPKIEGGIILNAPHCIEMSLQGVAWYLKAFGFALECAGAYKNG